MRIGVPKEIKAHEYRVGLTPRSVRECIAHGHEVFIETKAGIGIDIQDSQYRQIGAVILDSAAEIYNHCDLIVKIKEPQPVECKMLREGQILFAYLHLAPDKKKTQLLLEAGCVAIAYETVTDRHGALPLLAPSSAVAGSIAVHAGAYALHKEHGGRGIFLGGVTGVAPGEVIILGGGVVGTHSARMAIGLGAQVTVLDKSLDRLKQLESQFDMRLHTIYATKDAVEEYVAQADLVIGAVLVPGAFAPKLVSKGMLSSMKKGAVLLDVSIDQGGCFETSIPTTHSHPTYVMNGVVHYCVSNMPGCVPHTSTFALNNATLPFVLALADKGYQRALMEDPYFREGLNLCKGKITHPEIANAVGNKYYTPTEVLV